MSISKVQSKCCAVILSGGLNSRMAGRNKAFLNVGGRSIIDRLLTRLRPFFREILLVTRQPERYAGLPVKVTRDIYDARASMTGVHAGLVQADADYAFMVPCDAPFLQPAVIRQLLGAWSPAVDVIVPLVGGHYEPLCAIYSKRCIPLIEEQLERRNYRIYDLFDRVRVKTLDEETLRRADPEMISFLNINTPAALAASRCLVEKIESYPMISDLIF